jgi:hydroxymethylglutaryl-CoA lyase
MSTYALPSKVTLQEEGPREGFQSEGPVSVENKVRLIEALALAGLQEINCVSFVDLRKVPQMADAERVASAIRRAPHVRYTGMWLNRRGFERATASGVDMNPNVVCSVSTTFSVHNNGCDLEQLMVRQAALLHAYQEAGMRLQAAHVLTAFGCQYEGPSDPVACLNALDKLLGVCREHGELPKVVYLCDTVGAANPLSVRRTVDLVRNRWPDLEFALHLHDTRGMGLANVMAGLESGISRYDSSIGGLGGCPFAGNKAAAGNVATEDVALMCEEMGISTGLDLDRLADAARLAEAIVGHPLPGKFMRSGRLVRAGSTASLGNATASGGQRCAPL